MLGQITDPIILKRRVSEVAADLPERIVVELPIVLEPEHVKLYEQVRIETLEKYPVVGNLVATEQLQLFCAHPWLSIKELDASMCSLFSYPKIY
jgi:SNF2 family DNA or RNA helicase